MNKAEQNENEVLVWLKQFGWLLLSQLLYLMYPDRDEKSGRVILKRILERMIEKRLIFTRVLPDGTLIFLLGQRGAELIEGMPGRNLRAVEWKHRLIANWAAIIAINEGNSVITEYQIQQDRARYIEGGKLPDGVETVHDVEDSSCWIEAEAGYKKPWERNKIIATAIAIAAREVTISEKNDTEETKEPDEAGVVNEEKTTIEALKIVSADPLSEKRILKTLEKVLTSPGKELTEGVHYYLGQSLRFQRLSLTKQHNLVEWETEYGWDASDILDDYGYYHELWVKGQRISPTTNRQIKEMEEKVTNKRGRNTSKEHEND